MIRKVLAGLLAVVVLAIAALAGWLAIAPPDLLRVGTGYAAKMVCSNVFLAGRDATQVLTEDVQAQGNPILKTITVDVDRISGVVTAKALGVFATGWAVYRPGLGCAAVPDGDIAHARTVTVASTPAQAVAPPVTAPWPTGEAAGPVNERVQSLLADAALTGPGMRAVVVVKDGEIIAETYGPGFDGATPLLGWSMSKTVNAMLIGRLMADGRIALNDSGLVPQWANDPRKDITIADMTAMAPGLAFDEDQGDLSDATRMLFLEPDAAAFVASKPLVATPGKVFNYSTGTATLLSRIWMQEFASPTDALGWPRTALFDPLGMRSAVFEADEEGTIVGGAYLYATAHDWARIGQFLLQDGVWNDARLLPPGFVAQMDTSNGLPGGYSQMQSWTMGPHESDEGIDAGLPKDAFWLRGRDGQSIAVIPSKGLVVLRMGLTPSRLHFWPEPLVKAVIDALD